MRRDKRSLAKCRKSGAAAGVFDLNCGKSSNLVFGTDSRLGISVAIRRLACRPNIPKTWPISPDSD